MGKRIYVGNLPWSVTKDKLEGLFSSFGEIEEALVVANKYTGRSRGFGFVTFRTDKDADEAIGKMNGKEVEGRKLIVSEARPLAERKPEENEGHFTEKAPTHSSSEEKSRRGRKRKEEFN